MMMMIYFTDRDGGDNTREGCEGIAVRLDGFARVG
jgi:hypothetical protein